MKRKKAMPMIVLIFLTPTTHIHKEKERFYYDCQTSQAGGTAACAAHAVQPCAIWLCR